MDENSGSALREALEGLGGEVSSGPQARFHALAELERAQAVLLSLGARFVGSIADDVAERQLAEERHGGRGVFSFSTREAALLELAPALGVSPKCAKATLVFAETLREYPKVAARLASGEVTAKTAQFVAQQLRSRGKPNWTRGLWRRRRVGGCAPGPKSKTSCRPST